jgi:hypothetical protein
MHPRDAPNVEECFVSTPAEIEIFLPPPEPPVVLGSPDDAWALCAAVHADGDALLAVLSDGDRRCTLPWRQPTPSCSSSGSAWSCGLMW